MLSVQSIESPCSTLKGSSRCPRRACQRRRHQPLRNQHGRTSSEEALGAVCGARGAAQALAALPSRPGARLQWWIACCALFVSFPSCAFIFWHLPPADFKSPADVLDYDVLAEAFSHKDAGLGGAGPGTSSRHQGSTGMPTSIAAAATVGVQPGDSVSALGGPLVHVPSPAYDYVPPHLISLFVTDMGGYTPSYVYRLLAEFYDRADYLLSRENF